MRKRIRLTKEEREFEAEVARGEWVPVPKAEFEKMARSLARWRKDAVLNIRINSEDLRRLKKKAKELGVPYQTMVSELLHQYVA